MKTKHHRRKTHLHTNLQTHLAISKPELFLYVIMSIVMASFCQADIQTPTSASPAQITSNWRNYGGHIVMQGNYKLSETWYTSSSHIKVDKYWQGGYYLPEKKRRYHKWEPVVKKAVAPDIGTFTVEGPGMVVTCLRRKGPSLKIMDVATKGSFLPTSHDTYFMSGRWSANGRYPNMADSNTRKNGRGVIPVGKTMKLKVSIHAAEYNNFINTGELSWHAPQSMAYEIWYFPREQGKLVSVVKNKPDNPDDPHKKPIIHHGDDALTPIADSHVYAYNYRNWNLCNLGAYEILGAGHSAIGGDKRTYLKFDLSRLAIPSGQRVKLRLFHYHTGGRRTGKLAIYPVTSAWKEGRGTYHSGSMEQIAPPGEISWVRQPSINWKPAATFQPDTVANKFIEVDVTDLIKSWKAGQANHGMVIAPVRNEGGANLDYAFGFYSREYKDADKRPALVIGTSTNTGNTVNTGNTNGDDPPPPPPTGALQVRAGHKQIKKDQTFHLPVWLDFPKTFPRTRDGRINVANLNIEIHYNPNVIRAGSTTLKGNILGNALFQANSRQAGVIKLGFATKKGIMLSGTLAQLPFQAVGQPGQRSPVSIKVTTVNDDKGRSPQVKVVHGYVQILNKAVIGDINGNGIIDAGDALSALKMSVGLIPQDLILNIDQKDQVTSNDARLLLKKAVQGGGTVPQTPTPATTTSNQKTPPNVANVTSADAKRAYQEYIAAYNKMTSLMAKGQGDTPAAQQAYAAYKAAKDRYEAALKTGPAVK